MNAVHIHLILNHIPILGTLFALIVLSFGFFLKNETLARTSLITMVVCALVAIPVFISGEDAEHLVEGYPGVSAINIEDHEEQAEIAYWAILVSGAVALGTLLADRKTHKISSALQLINLGFMLVVFVLMVRAGNSGGQIRHPEINSTSAPVYQMEEKHNHSD